MVEYTTTYENSNYDKSAYAMSSNDNYILKIVSYADGQKIAYVADLKGLKSHEFSITDSIIENDLKNIKFTYIKTVKHKFARTMARGIYFDFVSISNNDGVETIKQRLLQWNNYKSKNGGSPIIVGGNIGKNKITPTAAGMNKTPKC